MNSQRIHKLNLVPKELRNLIHGQRKLVSEEFRNLIHGQRKL
jgi:hypothetical protein